MRSPVAVGDWTQGNAVPAQCLGVIPPKGQATGCFISWLFSALAWGSQGSVTRMACPVSPALEKSPNHEIQLLIFGSPQGGLAWQDLGDRKKQDRGRVWEKTHSGKQPHKSPISVSVSALGFLRLHLEASYPPRGWLWFFSFTDKKIES